ncbi:MAG: SGNH/GDSL hydrolase family protein, partial [bacterium]|nr:SGNH/GDSL hydrolase family protein [bacterium]
AHERVYSTPGFIIFGNPHWPDAIRIFTLGGSTTDALHDEVNWPIYLYQICRDAGIPVVVFNGGISGYASSQEMLKLIRDVIPLHPAIVISLNGVNDLGFSLAMKENPMVHLYQKQLMEFLSKTVKPAFVPNIITAFRRWRKKRTTPMNRILGFHVGPKTRTSPAQHWEKNIRIMHSLSKEFNFHYITFLQPLLGYGKYNPSATEKSWMAVKGPGYSRVLNEAGIRLKTGKLPFVVDITDVLAGKTAFFKNPKHLKAKVNLVVAKAVFKQLTERGLLEKSPISFLKNKNQLRHWHDFYTTMWKRQGEIKVVPDCISAPDGSSGADQIIFSGKATLFQSNAVPVRKGDEVRGGIRLCSAAPTTLHLSIARHITPAEYEGTSKVLHITSTPTRFDISHTFKRDAGSARLQLYSPKGKVEVYAWGAQLYGIKK